MMNAISTFVGGSIIFLIGYAATSPFTLGPTPFADIHEMTFINGEVISDRTFYAKGDAPIRIADWRVTIVSVSHDSPSCQTVPGIELHEGWSRYYPGRNKSTMSLDDWVGDPGCLSRLADGNFAMLATWSPRDGSPPVTAMTEFTIGGDPAETVHWDF